MVGIAKRTRTICYLALMSALIALCSLIAIPTTPPITLQTFAIFLSLMLIGGRLGLVSVLVYLFLGLIGLPVFAGFSSGIGHFLSPSGGYLIGFIVGAVFYLILEVIFGSGRKRKLIYSLFSLIIIYIVAVLWLVFAYSGRDSMNLIYAITAFVLPFVPLDCVKLALAYFVVLKLQRLNISE